MKARTEELSDLLDDQTIINRQLTQRLGAQESKNNDLKKAMAMQDKRLAAQEAEIESLKSVPGKGCYRMPNTAEIVNELCQREFANFFGADRSSPRSPSCGIVIYPL